MINHIKIIITTYILIIICKYIIDLNQNLNYIYKIKYCKPYKENHLKILSYNIQRIPFYFMPNIDIEHLFKTTKSDILCLQEDFIQFNQSNSYNKNQNMAIIRPSTSKYYKLVNCGLTIYSKIKINKSKFIPFNLASHVEKIVDKGFLIAELDNLILINTHLQYGDKKCACDQLNQIKSYIRNNYEQNKRIILVGDFNIDLNSIKIPNFRTIIPQIPTHYSSKINPALDTLASLKKLSDTEKRKYEPNYIDGGFYSNLKLKSINYGIFDPFADHKAIVIDLEII